jgi:3-oxoacyl-[acyl-carrier-protein] synthase III
MTGAGLPPLWCDPTPLLLLGAGTALRGEPISTEDLLVGVDRRFNLSLHRPGMSIAHKLGIRTRHLCRDMAVRLETPRKGHRNPELAAAALRAALAEAGRTAGELSYLIGHTATPARLMPPNIGQVAAPLAYDGPFVEFRQACTGFANALVFAHGLLRAGAGPVAIVGSETGSVFCDLYWAREDAGQLVNLVQMGDAAAAVILARDDGRAGARLSHIYYGQAGRTHAPGLTVAGGGSDLPVCEAGFPEFRHDFVAIRRSGLDLLLRCAQAAERAGAGPSDYILPHQANGCMISILAAPLELAPERIVVIADKTGNTGSAAIWVIVDLVGAEPLRCFAALHGAGMVRAAARLEDVVLAQRTRKK